MGFNLVFTVIRGLDTAAFDDGALRGSVWLAAAPAIMLVLVTLVLCSVAILRGGSTPPDDGDARSETPLTTSTRAHQL